LLNCWKDEEEEEEEREEKDEFMFEAQCSEVSR
jgi:hypothetical protein